MTRRLIFVRHAESTANADGSLTCAIPGVPLSARGQAQAAALARAWPTDAGEPDDPPEDPPDGAPGSAGLESSGGALGRGGPVRALWSSPMRRALQTAEVLAGRLELPVRVHPRLFEFQIGDLHGRTDPASAALVAECFTRWQRHGELDFRPPGGESGAEIVARIRSALTDVLAELTDGTAVVVGHGTALRTALSRLATGLPPAHTLDHELPNTGLIVVDVGEPVPDGLPPLAVRSYSGVPGVAVTPGAGTR